jgi:phosphatidylserine decarboxylase
MDSHSVNDTDPHAPLRGVEPLPANIDSIQPGGGVCLSCELAWGRCRRWYLRRFRPAYVARLRSTRQGVGGTYPHDILDPRDLKFHRNLGDLHWPAAADPFAWRERLPIARVGWAEILLLGGGLALVAGALAAVCWPLALVPAAAALFVVYFFRHPPRRVPEAAGLVLAPADGRVFAIREVEHDEFVGGPAVVIDIFLSVFNVHLNRVPMGCRILGLTYRPGKFLNALRPRAAQENEALEVRLETTSPPIRGLRVRQIAGAIARRIVCWVRPGEHLPAGGPFGMIKLGSRTEITFPREPGLALQVRCGDRVRAGTTILARYAGDAAPSAVAGRAVGSESGAAGAAAPGGPRPGTER